MVQSHAPEQAPQQGGRGGNRSLKKINRVVAEELENFTTGKVRLMYQDEAGFGRINKPKYCWCFPGLRPEVPCHHIREYRYVYGAVEPLTGESFFLIFPYCNTDCMNIFLQHLSHEYPQDRIILICDGAAWQKALALAIPHNIRLVFLPPATPELNLIEQIWKEIRKRGFRNEVFKTLNCVIDRLCETICALSHSVVHSITARDWIVRCFH